MKTKSKFFVGLMIAAGVLALLSVALHPSWAAPLHFLVYLVLILLASGMKVAIPRTDGNGSMSLNFVFILLAIEQLTPTEAMIAGCLSVLAQCLFKVKKGFNLVQICFNTANIAVATFLAFTIYRSLLAQHAPAGIALALASTFYFLANTVPVAVILGWEGGTPVFSLWFSTFQWYFPFYLSGAIIAASVEFIARRYGWLTSLLVFPAAWAMYASYRSYFGRLQDQKHHIGQMAELHMRTIEALALAIEAKDQNTHDHLCRVRVYAMEVGRELNLTDGEMDALRAAALLHDIGKLAVPEHIINKPGKLSHEEFEKMKIHPVVGAEILERVNFPYPVAPVVRAHHERWDGKGYPDGLAGESIPIGARILSAVDCLDALATDRPYRRALSLTDAIAYVKGLAHTQFDPRVVEVLARRCEELEALARKEGAAMAPLNIHVKVQRGDAPAAGFEKDSSGSTLLCTETQATGVKARTYLSDTVNHLRSILDASLALDETFSQFSSELSALMGFDTIAIYVRHKERLLPKFVAGDEKLLFSSLEIPLGEGLSGWVAQNRLPVINGNPSVEPGYLGDSSQASMLRSALSIPLENAQHEVLGTLTLYAKETDKFTREDLSLLQRIAPEIARSIENALRYHLAQTHTTADFLTRALNSHAFLIRLEADLKKCAVKNQPLSLLLCDIDGFSSINEQFGHVEADRFLSHLADRFREIIREGDSLGRLGGDEFALLFPGLDARTAEGRLRELRATLRDASLDIFPGGFQATASLGISSFSETPITAAELLEAADNSMQVAKRTRVENPPRRAVLPLAVARV